MTRQRALILEIIQSSESHLTAVEIFLLAQKQMPTIVRATIYNNLNALTEKGLIRRVKIYERPDYYDRTLRLHDHLVCDQCGRLTDIALGDLLQEFRKKSRIGITGYELNLHYICPECRKQNEDMQFRQRRQNKLKGDLIHGNRKEADQ